MIKWIEKGADVLDGAFKNVCGGSVIHSGTMVMDSVVKALHGVNQDLRDNIKFIGKTEFTCGYLNYNAETLHPHTEEDTTMTLACIPLQEGLNSYENRQLSFNFYISGQDMPDEIPVMVPLVPGVSVFLMVSF